MWHLRSGRHRSSSAALVAAFALTACSFGERFLVPDPRWVAEPSALGLSFEEVVLPTGDDTTVHGWFVPSARSDGRTVVLCHGNAANISFYHPYYRFLHAAGFHVFLFDYRGYGKSRGERSVEALFADTDAALAHVFARPDVARDKVALFGMSLGAIVALRAAASHPELCGLVIEDASSPRALLRQQAGAFLTWWAELLALPGDLEPVDNAARHRGPALFLCGEWDAALQQHLAAAAAHAGPTASWVLPETGHAPAGLLQHDGEYEGAITSFLHACAEGRAPGLDVTVGAIADGRAPVTVTRRDFGDEPMAVELALVGDDANVRFERLWLRGERATVTLPVPAPPRFVAAWPRAAVEAADDSDTWQPRHGPLRRAAELQPILRDLAIRATHETDGAASARAFVATLQRHEAEHGPLPSLAAAELVPDLVAVARALSAGDRADDRAAARALYERALAAEPADPRLHYWPAANYVLGFQYAAWLDEARARLAELNDQEVAAVLRRAARPGPDDAASPPEPNGRPDPLVVWLRWVTATPLAELRPALLQGIERRELHRIRFDGSTAAESIDRVVAAAERHRERPLPDGAATALRDAVAAYVDARREAQVAASAGAASCMPEPR